MVREATGWIPPEYATPQEFYRSRGIDEFPTYGGSMGGFSSIIGGIARSFGPASGPPTNWWDLASGIGQTAVDIYRRTQVPTVPGGRVPPVPGIGGNIPVTAEDLRKIAESMGRRGVPTFKTCVRPCRVYRRMNVTNMRALNRAMRRVRGFEKKARRVLTITTGKRPKTRFKRRR